MLKRCNDGYENIKNCRISNANTSRIISPDTILYVGEIKMDDTIFINYHERRIEETRSFIKKLEEQLRFHQERLKEIKLERLKEGKEND